MSQMNNIEFIKLSDIKMLSAEDAQENVKKYLDFLYTRFMECTDVDELSIREEFLREAVYSAAGFGFIDFKLQRELLYEIQVMFRERNGALIRKENK